MLFFYTTVVCLILYCIDKIQHGAVLLTNGYYEVVLIPSKINYIIYHKFINCTSFLGRFLAIGSYMYGRPQTCAQFSDFFLIKVTFIDAFLIVLKLISNVLYKKCNRVFGHYHLKQDDLNYFWCPLDSLCKISNCVSHLLLFFLIKWITCLEKNTYYPL